MSADAYGIGRAANRVRQHPNGLRPSLGHAGNQVSAHFALFANYGRLLLEEGTVPNPFNMVEVNRELDRALELNPNHVDALISKGGLYRQLPWLLGGSLKKAEACLTRAIELDANAVGGRIELAATYRDMGEPERGVPLLEKAIQVAQQVGKFRQLAEARALLDEIRP
jgi:tetratricopeptide (TPR) repeat protein